MLTAAKIRAAEPGARPYKIADGAGLYLYVAPTGLKSLRMSFRYGGRAQLLTFGRVPEISLAEARDRRDDARRQLRQGINPAVARKRAIVAPDTTFEAVARRWYAAKRPSWSDAHAADVIGSLERHVFPRLGKNPIGEIASPTILACLRQIENSGSIETARRIRQRISAVFHRGLVEDLVRADPAAPAAKALAERIDVRRQAALLEEDEIRAAYAAIAAADAPAIARLAAQLVALTAVRTASARGARWEELSGVIDDDNSSPAMWRIPAARMKLKKSRKTDRANDHLVPLSLAAVDLLRLARARAGDSPFVFPRRPGAGAPIGVNAILAVHRAAGLAGRHSPHGWRAAFATVLNERRPEDRAAIDLALAHAPKDKVEAAYNRSRQMDRRRGLYEAWADILTRTPAGL